MKSIIRIALIAVVAVLAYNYFYGSEEEKATTQRVLDEVKDVGVAIKDFVKAEHQSIKEGKYDKVLSSVGQKLEEVGQKLNKEDAAGQREYQSLQQEQRDLEISLRDLKKDPDAPNYEQQKDELAQQLKDLVDKINEFSKRQK